MKKRIALLCLLSLSGACFATEVSPSRRMERRTGLTLNILGDPFVSILGASLHYNATDFLRLSGSVCLLGIGGGIKLFIPTWNLSPVIGANVSTTLAWNGVSFPVGLDWQLPSGWNIGVGLNLGAIPWGKTDGYYSGRQAALPYLYTGGYF